MLDETFNIQFTRRYQNLLRAPEDSNTKLRQVISGIALATQRAQKHLTIGYRAPHDITYFSWACRTVLELNVWAQWIAKSKKNAEALHADMTVDNHEILRNMEKNAPLMSPAELIAANIDDLVAIRARLDEAAKQAGVDDYERKHMDVRKKAEDLGQDEYRSFDIGFRLLSKFVHPSGLSLLMPGFQHSSELDLFFKPAARQALNIAVTLSAASLVWEFEGYDLQGNIHTMMPPPRER